MSQGLYNMERPSAIISLDPMLSRAQGLLGPENNYTTYQVTVEHCHWSRF